MKSDTLLRRLSCGLLPFIVAIGTAAAATPRAGAAPIATPHFEIPHQSVTRTIKGYAVTERIDEPALFDGGPETARVNVQLGHATSRLQQQFESAAQQSLPFQSGPGELLVSTESSYVSPRAASIMLNAYEYLPGGAHGSAFQVSLTFDLTTGAPLRLTDIVEPTSLEQIATLASAFLPNAFPPGQIPGCTNEPSAVLGTLQQAAPDPWTNGGLSGSGPAAGLSSAGLLLGFQDDVLGPHAASCNVLITLPYASLRRSLRAEYMPAVIPGLVAPPGEPPLDQCPIESVSVAADASFTLFSVEMGAGSSVTLTHNASSEADHAYSVEADADLKLGGHLILGDGTKLGNTGIGATADIAAGISLGAGLGYENLSESDAVPLSHAFQQNQDPSTGSTLANHPSKVSVDAGVWLNGGVDLSTPGGPSGGIEGQAAAAIGYEIDLDSSQNITGQAVLFSASGSIDASGDTGPILGPLGAGGGATFEAGAQLTIRLNPKSEVTGVEAGITGTLTTAKDVTAGFDASSLSKKLKGDFGGSVSNSQGYGVQYVTQLDTSGNPTATAALNQLLSSLLDTNGGPPISSASVANALSELAPAAHSLLLVSGVQATTGKAGFKLSDPLALAVDANQTHTDRQTQTALWEPSGSTTFVPWLGCQNAIDAANASSGTASTPVPSGSATPTAPRPAVPLPTTPTTPTTATPTTIRVVSTSGQVGKLQFGRSSEAEVRADIGVPDATVPGSFSVPSEPSYQALGYDCSSVKDVNRTSLGAYQSDQLAPYCRTVYYINSKTGTLEGFWTTSPEYGTTNGTTAGMTSAEAQRRENSPVTGGCHQGIELGDHSSKASVLVSVDPSANDRVLSLASDSKTDSVGVLFC